ncbi:MAG: hypothetical protein ACYS9X_22090 [Planctomycetota bacterium]|jgi:hypothetical protein
MRPARLSVETKPDGSYPIESGGVRLEARAAAKRGRDTLIALMAEDAPGLPDAAERAHVLYIDPSRIGMVAGRQILRRRNPWAEPTRLLVPARELGPAFVSRKKEKRA